MSIFGETKCNFSPVSTEVYTALIHHFSCRLEARQALIYQLVSGLTGENGKYNYSRAVHVYPPFFDIPCSAKNYKIAPALTLLTQIIRMKDKELHSRTASYEQELKAASSRVNELERLMQNLYEDKCTGVVPQSVFQTLMKKYEAERAQKAAAIPELERKVRAQMENRHDADRWAEIIRRYTEITELDETILFELVDRIEVGEAQKCGKTRIQDVKVFYRYVGCVDDAMAGERQEAV